MGTYAESENRFFDHACLGSYLAVHPHRRGDYIRGKLERRYSHRFTPTGVGITISGAFHQVQEPGSPHTHQCGVHDAPFCRESSHLPQSRRPPAARAGAIHRREPGG